MLVARRTPSGTGPIVGATATVAVLRRARWRPFAIEGEGLRLRPPAVDELPRP